MQTTRRLLLWLMAIYLVLFTVLAIHPFDRLTWFSENLTVWIVLAFIFGLYARGIRFSKTAYLFMFVFVYMHTIGGHYTFERVPFGFVTEFFGFTRNNFDRLGHFTVGFYAFMIAEWLWTRRLVANRWLLFTYPVFLIASVAMIYELIEWVYAAAASAEAGSAYLGSQGDIWDAQKDMLADTLGALVSTIIFFFIHGLWNKKLK